MLLSFAKTGHFYPRSPRGERLTTNGSISGDYEFLSTLPARGATTRKPDGEGGYTISIHAPREGSDSSNYGIRPMIIMISIHAPREGSDADNCCKQSGRTDISIHAPREGSDFCLTNYDTTMEISIHAPREGSDMPAKCSCIGSNGFLSTLPARGATIPFALPGLNDYVFLSTLPARGAT